MRAGDRTVLVLSIAAAVWLSACAHVRPPRTEACILADTTLRANWYLAPDHDGEPAKADASKPRMHHPSPTAECDRDLYLGMLNVGNDVPNAEIQVVGWDDRYGPLTLEHGSLEVFALGTFRCRLPTTVVVRTPEACLRTSITDPMPSALPGGSAPCCVQTVTPTSGRSATPR